MAPEDLEKLLVKYLEGKCTKEESDYVNSWYSALGSDRIPGPLEENIAAAEERMLENIQVHAGAGAVTEDLPPVRSGMRRAWLYSGVAASIVFVLAIGYYFVPSKSAAPSPVQTVTEAVTSIENYSDTARRVILPDGSIVRMSPQSRIRVSNAAGSPSRELFLEGEAYFDVAHNPERPFFVYAGNVVTRVLGTSFIVRAVGSDDKVTVSVKTGKVTVYSRNATHKKTVLVPNQEAVYDQQTDVVATLAVPVVLHQHTENVTEMHFDETPVSEVLSTLEKAFDITIVFQKEALSGCVLTSSFYEEGLYDRIDVICTAIGATYQIVDAQIVVDSKGCNLKPE